MDYSDGESGSDGELVDDILGPEDLFNDEADEEETAQDPINETSEKIKTEDEDSKEKVEKKIRPSRIVKNPRVTLKVHMLSGKNGLSALKKLFTNFKFKGNGHEKEDLSKIMGILKQWMCYQLCPSYDFESCMLQLEALGKKKAVQTLMKKYRLGMDEWGESKSESEDLSGLDKDGATMEADENIGGTNDYDLLSNEEIHGADDDINLSGGSVTVNPSAPPQEFTLTQEQLDRIARNRRLAEERRQRAISAHVEQMQITELPENNGDHNISAEKTISEDIS